MNTLTVQTISKKFSRKRKRFTMYKAIAVPAFGIQRRKHKNRLYNKELTKWRSSYFWPGYVKYLSGKPHTFRQNDRRTLVHNVLTPVAPGRHVDSHGQLKCDARQTFAATELFLAAIYAIDARHAAKKRCNPGRIYSVFNMSKEFLWRRFHFFESCWKIVCKNSIWLCVLSYFRDITLPILLH